MSLTVNSRPATWAGTSGPIIYKMTTTDHANAGYYLLVEIWNSTTGLKIGSQKCYPNSAGLLSVRVEAILKSNMSLDNNSDLTTSDVVYVDGNWIKYYIKYNQYWSGSSPSLIDDVANLRYAIYGGLQIGVINDFSMQSFTSNNINESNNSVFKFLTESVILTSIKNYPITLSFLSTFKNLRKEAYKSGILQSTTNTPITDSEKIDRLKIIESGDIDQLKIRLEHQDFTFTNRSAGTNGWASSAFGNGIYVIISNNTAGANGAITSTDGITWTFRTTVGSPNIYSGLCFGNGLFVAVSGSGTGSAVMTSPDGITWTTRTTPGGIAWQAVTFGNGLFVAVGNSGTGNRVMTSSDGITWTLRTSAADNNWRAVTYGNGLFVATSNSGTGNRVMTSPDGITWTIRTSAGDYGWLGVTFGNSLFVAVADSGILTDQVMTSPDGITWTLRTTPNVGLKAVTFGNNYFVAVAGSGANRAIYSKNGINWTMATTSARDFSTICYGNGLFVAAADAIISDNVMTSPMIDQVSETKIINILDELSNTILLQWKNSLGGDECYPFTYNQEYTFDYGGGKKAKRLTLFAYGLTLAQWEAINGLNTLGEPYKTPITEMTTNLNRTMATIGQSVYILNSDGTKIGVTVINVQNTTVTKKVQHEATVTIEYPEIFLQ